MLLKQSGGVYTVKDYHKVLAAFASRKSIGPERTMNMLNACQLLKAGGLILTMAFAAVPACAKNAQTLAPAPISLTVVKQQSPQKDPNMLYAIGEGAMPTVTEQPNRAKAYLQAKAYAKAEAVANLIQAAEGTSISYHATGKDFGMEEQVNQEIEGMVEHVQIVSERKVQVGKDTVVEVTVESPIPERWKAAPARKAASAKPTEKKASENAEPSWVTETAQTAAPARVAVQRAKESVYTSLIVNAHGLGVSRSMSPKILRQDGSELWGTVKVNYDFIADHGIVAYTRTMGEAYSNERAGDNPLVIRAIDRGPSSYKSDVILSDADADYLVSENKRGKFLQDFRVIFVVDASQF